MGVKSNCCTNRLKLLLSFLRIVDDYPSNGPMVLSIRSSKANTNNVSDIARFYCYHKNNRITGFLCLLQKLLAT